MKKVLMLEDLDCANCAAKIEDAIRGIKGVKSARVSFLTQKITLDIAEEADFDGIVTQIAKTIKRVEPDCRLLG